MLNSDKIILDLCGGTGAWSRPYADKGYTVYILTLPYDDVKTLRPERFFNDGNEVYGILAAPPCTCFCNFGAVWNQKRPWYEIKEACDVLTACLAIIDFCWLRGTHLKFWALENPTGRLSEQGGVAVRRGDPDLYRLVPSIMVLMC